MKTGKMQAVSLAFVLPGLLYMLFLIGYPLLYNIAISFQDLSLLNLHNARFVGFANYADIFGRDTFWTALGNTFTFTSGASFFNL